MKELNLHIDEKTLEKIISAAYGSANIIDKIEVFFLRKKNPEAEKIYKEYKQTADEVHSLKHEELPESVLSGVKEKINEDIPTKEKKSFVSDLAGLVLLKPQASFATVIILVTAITFSIFTGGDMQKPHYSRAEIESATQQTKHALALVSGILLSTENTITKDIIPNKVVKPVNESFNYVNQFMRGDKNETVN